jgi:hypothetical protein
MQDVVAALATILVRVFISLFLLFGFCMTGSLEFADR